LKTHLFLPLKNQKYPFYLLISRKKIKKKNKEKKSKDKCKIILYGWLKLQIARSRIKNNLEVFGISQNNNLISTVKFHQNT
jgi:hypothetical protein